MSQITLLQPVAPSKATQLSSTQKAIAPKVIAIPSDSSSSITLSNPKKLSWSNDQTEFQSEDGTPTTVYQNCTINIQVGRDQHIPTLNTIPGFPSHFLPQGIPIPMSPPHFQQYLPNYNVTPSIPYNTNQFSPNHISPTQFQMQTSTMFQQYYHTHTDNPSAYEHQQQQQYYTQNTTTSPPFLMSHPSKPITNDKQNLNTNRSRVIRNPYAKKITTNLSTHKNNYKQDWGGIPDEDLARIDDVVQNQARQHFSKVHTKGRNTTKDMYGGITNADIEQVALNINQNTQANIDGTTQKRRCIMKNPYKK